MAVGCCALAAAWAVSAPAQETPPEDPVVATVGDEPIRRGDAGRVLARVTRGRDVDPAVLPVLQAQALEEVVKRHLVLAYARRNGVAAADARVDRTLADLREELAKQDRSLEQFLDERQLDEADLRRQIVWELTFPRFLRQYATDERIQQHFEAHRREFDGTEVSVRHILLRGESREEVFERARELRQAITSGRTTFEEAARQQSAGATAAEGGAIGFIPRHGVMADPFARAAFALKEGEVSEPVVTPFGVHLVRVDAVKPGGIGLDEVRDQVRESLAQSLLDKLAAYERKHTPVKYTGAMPHFQPGTKKLSGTGK